MKYEDMSRMYNALDILENDEKRFWKEIAPDLPPRVIDEILYLHGATARDELTRLSQDMGLYDTNDNPLKRE